MLMICEGSKSSDAACIRPLALEVLHVILHNAGGFATCTTTPLLSLHERTMQI